MDCTLFHTLDVGLLIVYIKTNKERRQIDNIVNFTKIKIQNTGIYNNNNNNNNNLLFQTMVHMKKKIYIYIYMYNKIQIKGINK